MAKIDGPKYLGALKVDLTAMADDMQDIAPVLPPALEDAFAAILAHAA